MTQLANLKIKYIYVAQLTTDKKLHLQYFTFRTDSVTLLAPPDTILLYLVCVAAARSDTRPVVRHHIVICKRQPITGQVRGHPKTPSPLQPIIGKSLFTV